MDQTTQDALVRWKSHRYRPTDVPFALGVESLTSEAPLIEARQSETRKTDWVLCRTGTSTPATFVFAGVFAEADSYDTGNFVPKGEPVPAGLDESRVAQHAGYKPAYSYAIETYHDKDIWELHTLLDAYMSNVPGFNARGVKCRQWQSGSSWHWRYYFRVPMFLTCESRGGRLEPPPGLHKWVVAAHRKSRNYRANPVKPAVCGLEDGRLQRIEDCRPNVLEYGDVVSIVFTLAFIEDRDDWGPVTMISHIIRVQHANKEAYRLTATLIPPEIPVDNAGLVIGTVVDPAQAPLSPVLIGALQTAGETTGVARVTSTVNEEGPSAASASGTRAEDGIDLPGYDALALVADPPLFVSPTGTTPRVDTRGRSESEMDVDDDDKDTDVVSAISLGDLNDGDGDGGNSSGASTLADVPEPFSGESTPRNTLGKKRVRRRSGSGDDSESTTRVGRPPGSSLSRRGAKGARNRVSEHT